MGLQIQFHATREEIAALVFGSVDKFGLWAAYETGVPEYKNALIAQGGMSEPFIPPPGPGTILLNRSPLIMIREGAYGVSFHNPECLILQMEAETPGVLGESSLAARTMNTDTMRVWNKIKRSITTTMTHGGRVVNTESGASGKVRGHYFSPAAVEMFVKGGRLAGPSDVLDYEVDAADVAADKPSR